MVRGGVRSLEPSSTLLATSRSQPLISDLRTAACSSSPGRCINIPALFSRSAARPENGRVRRPISRHFRFVESILGERVPGVRHRDCTRGNGVRDLPAREPRDPHSQTAWPRACRFIASTRSACSGASIKLCNSLRIFLQIVKLVSVPQAVAANVFPSSADQRVQRWCVRIVAFPVVLIEQLLTVQTARVVTTQLRARNSHHPDWQAEAMTWHREWSAQCRCWPPVPQTLSWLVSFPSPP